MRSMSKRNEKTESFELLENVDEFMVVVLGRFMGETFMKI